MGSDDGIDWLHEVQADQSRGLMKPLLQNFRIYGNEKEMK
jgi:hypothetical protein